MTEGRAWTYFNGAWLEGNPPILGPLSHAMWLSSVVFDGARAFEGVLPDLDRHCRRVVDSAQVLGLEPQVTPGEIQEIAEAAVGRFRPGAALYIRPMFFAERGFVVPEPDSTQFLVTVHEKPMPAATGSSACLSPLRRPSPEMALTRAKASCHYPQAAAALREAAARGFGNTVMCDPIGNVAEFATANLFLVKDGIAATPIDNGTFLNGITRQRVIALLRRDGVTVEERAIQPAEVLTADEVFATGNYGKVTAFTRIEDRDLQPGPVYRRARELYWDFAHSAASEAA